MNSSESNGDKETRADTNMTGTASKMAQKKHKDSTKGGKIGDADKRKRVWMPPGHGAFIG